MIVLKEYGLQPHHSVFLDPFVVLLSKFGTYSSTKSVNVDIPRPTIPKYLLIKFTWTHLWASISILCSEVKGKMDSLCSNVQGNPTFDWKIFVGRMGQVANDFTKMEVTFRYWNLHNLKITILFRWGRKYMRLRRLTERIFELIGAMSLPQ